MHGMAWHGRSMALLINSVHQAQNTLPPFPTTQAPVARGSSSRRLLAIPLPKALRSPQTEGDSRCWTRS
jgi:hypothetical protein